MDGRFIRLKIIDRTDDYADALYVRRKVFIEEQKVSERIERDEYDKKATHIIAYYNDKPIGTARIVEKEDKYYIGRVATLKEYRGQGIGKLIMKELMKWAFNKGIKKIYLHSQKHAEDFYKDLGFISYGDVYLEEGIEHISMYTESQNTR